MPRRRRSRSVLPHRRVVELTAKRDDIVAAAAVCQADGNPALSSARCPRRAGAIGKAISFRITSAETAGGGRRTAQIQNEAASCPVASFCIVSSAGHFPCHYQRMPIAEGPAGPKTLALTPPAGTLEQVKECTRPSAATDPPQL